MVAASNGNAFIELVQFNLRAKAFNESNLQPYVSGAVNSYDRLEATIEEEYRKRDQVLASRQAAASAVALLPRAVETEAQPPRISMAAPAIISGDLVSSAMVGLTKAGIEIWKAAQVKKQADVEAIYKELERRRWDDWSKVYK